MPPALRRGWLTNTMPSVTPFITVAVRNFVVFVLGCKQQERQKGNPIHEQENPQPERRPWTKILPRTIGFLEIHIRGGG